MNMRCPHPSSRVARDRVIDFDFVVVGVVILDYFPVPGPHHCPCLSELASAGVFHPAHPGQLQSTSPRATSTKHPPRPTMARNGSRRLEDAPPFEPLPDNVFSRQTHPTWHDAYARCTRLFFWAVGRQPPPGSASYDMCSRVLGHLVLEAPTERGRDWVCKKILNCADEHALARLAQKYIFTFVGACTFLSPLSGLRSRFPALKCSSFTPTNPTQFIKSKLPLDDRSRAAAVRPSPRPVAKVVPI